VLSDGPFASWRASGIHLAHGRGEARVVLLILLRSPLGPAYPPALPGVGQAFC
jgi:hypothetical protein